MKQCSRHFLSPSQKLIRTCVLNSLALACLIQSSAFALPTGWEVIQGDVSFQQNGNILTITSQSQQSIVNYISFNLASGETVNFILPSINASILNRIIGGQASSIAGQITGNGQIAIVNNAGINIANSAQIQAAGLLLSTLDISNQSFLSQTQQFIKNPGANNAAVNNNGTISANQINIVSSQINNNGTILGGDGQIHLAVGDKITIGLSNNQTLSLTIDEGMKKSIDQLNQATIQNNGYIQAHDINIQSKLSDTLLSQAITNEGIIQGTALANVGGQIKIIGNSDSSEGGAIVTNHNLVYAGATNENPVAGSILMQGNVTENTGALMANSGVGASGGRIEMLGDYVSNTQGAYLDASGDVGGGTILVGGDYQGTGDTYRAKMNISDETLVVNNDAIRSGNGGKTIFWADQDTYFKGKIYGRGGLDSGNGGFAEVSGYGYLDFQGLADLTAEHGEKGTLLLDPTDINIITFDITTINRVFHLDGSNVAAGGTAACGGFTCINTWNDTSGNGRNFTQGGGGLQPYLIANAQNGLSVARFNSDYMTSPALGMAANSSYDYILLQKTSSFTNGGTNDGSGSYFNDRNPATNNLASLKAVGGRYYYQKRDDGGANLGGVTSTSNISTTNYQLVQYGREFNTAFRIYVNGTLEASSGANTNTNLTPPAARLGAHNGGGGNLNNDVAEFIMTNGTLSTANRQALEQHLFQKWNVNVDTTTLNNTYLSVAGVTTLVDTYLEALSQTSNISLTASNNINIGNLTDNLLNLGGTSTLTMSAGNQIIFADTNDMIRTEGQAINLTAAGGMTLGTLSTRGAAGTLNGNITLNSNNAVTWIGLNAGTGTVTVAPSSAATAIGVGGGAGAINLTNAKINTITAGTIQVGNTTNSGAININSANFTTPNSHVTLSTTGAIVADASAPNITLAGGRTLTITGGAAVGAGAVGTVGTALKTTVDDMVIRSTSNVYINESNALNVTAGSIGGLLTLNTLAAGNLSLSNLSVTGATTVTTNAGSITGNTNTFTGTTSFDANSGVAYDISLTASDFQNATNAFDGANVTVADTTGLTVSSVTASGTGSFTATGGANDLTVSNAAVTGNTTLSSGRNITATASNNFGTITGTANGAVAITETSNVSVNTLTNAGNGTVALTSTDGSIMGKNTAVADLTTGTGTVTLTAGDAGADASSVVNMKVATGGNVNAYARGQDGSNMSVNLRGTIAGNLVAQNNSGGGATVGNILLGSAVDNLGVTGTTAFNTTDDMISYGNVVGAVSGTAARIGVTDTAGDFTSGGLTASSGTGWNGASDESLIVVSNVGDILGTGYTASGAGNIRLQAGIAGAACTACNVNVANVSAAQNLSIYTQGDTTGAGNGNSITVNGTSNVAGSIIASGFNSAYNLVGTAGSINMALSSGNLTTGLAWAGNDDITLTASNGSILQNGAAYPWAFNGKTIHTGSGGDVYLNALGGAGSYIDTGVNTLGAGSNLTARAQGQNGSNMSIRLYGRVDGNLNAENQVGGNTVGDVFLGTSVGNINLLNDVYTVMDVVGNTNVKSARDVSLYGYYGNDINVDGRSLLVVADKVSSITKAINFGTVNLTGVAGTILDVTVSRGSILGGNITANAGTGNVILRAGTSLPQDKMTYVDLTNVNTGGNLTVWATGSDSGDSSGNSITITGTTGGTTTTNGAGGVGAPLGSVTTP